jgi:hypothetical protein
MNGIQVIGGLESQMTEIEIKMLFLHRTNIKNVWRRR